jgi:hypothetical protein
MPVRGYLRTKGKVWGWSVGIPELELWHATLPDVATFI